MEVYMIQFQFSEEILTEARRAIAEGRTIPLYSDTGFKAFFSRETEAAVFVATVSCPR